MSVEELTPKALIIDRRDIAMGNPQNTVMA